MKELIEEAKALLLFVIAGMLAALGWRAIEWSIPKPETRVLVCMADETGDVEICRTLDELTKEKQP